MEKRGVTNLCIAWGTRLAGLCVHLLLGRLVRGRLLKRVSLGGGRQLWLRMLLLGARSVLTDPRGTNRLTHD